MIAGQYPVAELQCWDKATEWEPNDMFYCEPMPLEATADNVQLSVFAAKALNSTVSKATQSKAQHSMRQHGTARCRRHTNATAYCLSDFDGTSCPCVFVCMAGVRPAVFAHAAEADRLSG